MLRLPPISSLSHSFPTRRSSILHICWTPRATTARRCAVSRKTGAFMRPSGRSPDQMRVIEMIPGFTRHDEGSCLINIGDTHVLCNASVEERLPPLLRGKGQDWVTAESGLPPPPPPTRGPPAP